MNLIEELMNFSPSERPILGFFDEHRFLSNFVPVNIEFEGMNFPSVEHAYVAAKTLNLGLRQQIADIKTAGQVKRFGQTFDIRPDWDSVKLSVMAQLLRLKFNQSPFKELLLNTGNCYIEETNNWGDKFWGVCNDVGQNNLGMILMNIRAELSRC